MEYLITEDGLHVDVKLTGDFTIEDAENFRNIFSWDNNTKNRSISLNLSDLESIDSAGLGMLLYANTKSEDKDWKFSLSNPVGQVKKVLLLSRIDEVITITE